MKRLIAAVSFAVLAGPAAAQVGAPYDQSMVDRALPQLPEIAVQDSRAPSGSRAPYDQLAVDRALPSFDAQRMVVSAALGATRSDAEIASEASLDSPWANDYHFITPAQ